MKFHNILIALLLTMLIAGGCSRSQKPARSPTPISALAPLAAAAPSQTPSVARQGTPATVVNASSGSRTAIPTVSGAPPDLVGVVASGAVEALQRLGARWYLTYTLGGEWPAGMQRATVVRLVPPPDQAALVLAVRAHPGSAWLIGNEPNVPTEATSDNQTPAQYAATLHTLAAAIRAADPAAVIVGPNVLNWQDTCVGCAGYPSGASWTAAFYDAYRAAYHERPPFDRWAIHTYELDWTHTPTLHPEFDIRQLAAFRGWLAGMPAEASRPIWDTELGFHWGFPGWTRDQQGKLSPSGAYDDAGVKHWLETLLAWLTSEGRATGVERTFLYAQAPPSEAFTEHYSGMALFSGSAADAPITAAGQQVQRFLRGP